MEEFTSVASASKQKERSGGLPTVSLHQSKAYLLIPQIPLGHSGNNGGKVTWQETQLEIHYYGCGLRHVVWAWTSHLTRVRKAGIPTQLMYGC